MTDPVILTPKQGPDDAIRLVDEFVTDGGLRRHMIAVGAAMRSYAERLDYDPDYWEAIGIIHDFDWEIHSDLSQHPVEGAPILKAKGWDDESIRVVLSHYTEGTGVAREKPIDFALLACDDITGLIIATTLVRPSKDIREVKLSSVRKKWKNSRFAAGVDRQHVVEATADFSQVCFGGELELWEHVENVLNAMKEASGRLGLDGQA